MKDLEASSWVCHIRHLLKKYRLLMVFDVISNSPANECWRHQVREAVHKIWPSVLRCEAHEISIFKHLNTDAFNMDLIWWNLSSWLSIINSTTTHALLSSSNLTNSRRQQSRHSSTPSSTPIISMHLTASMKRPAKTSSIRCTTKDLNLKLEGESGDKLA